jgi:hypothetical protein
MQTGSSTPRPTIARALELARRNTAAAVPARTAPAPALASSRYFAPGDYAAEQDWWAKQLGGRRK